MLRTLLLCGWFFLAFSHDAAAQAPAAVRQGEVTVEEGVRIRYVEAGSRDAKTTILFVPGWATSSAVWRDAMAALAGSARVIAIDPRSQGGSSITTAGNTPERRAQDLRAVTRALAPANVLLVGWSQGVQDVAAYAAAFEGDGIAGYVLVDSTVSAGPAVSAAQPGPLQQQLERFGIYSQYPRQYLRGMMNAIIRSPQGRARIDEYVEIGMRTPPDLGIGMLVMDFMAIDRRAALDKFNRPTLVIAAADSGELAAQREMAGRIRGAIFETIPDAGHAVFLDQPQRFHDLLAGFVQRLH